jgi:hypothetical protein
LFRFVPASLLRIHSAARCVARLVLLLLRLLLLLLRLLLLRLRLLLLLLRLLLLRLLLLLLLLLRRRSADDTVRVDWWCRSIVAS